MKVKKLKREKRSMTLEELNAYQITYSKPLGARDYTLFMGAPALILGGMGFFLTYYWWVGLGLAIIGVWYGYHVILPKIVIRNYEMTALQERNNFIRNLTISLTDENKTMLSALKITETRIYGELKLDIQTLIAGMIGSEQEQIQTRFEELSQKYKEDAVFCQFLEQIETAIYEGNNNVETIKEIQENHDLVLKKTKEFLDIKNSRKSDVKMMLMYVAIFVGMLSVIFGFKQFFESFARGIAGWVTSAIFILELSRVLNGFINRYFDDSITEVKVKK